MSSRQYMLSVIFDEFFLILFPKYFRYYEFVMNYLQRAKNFKAKRRLGQNFLIDEDVLNDIVEIAEVSKDDTVLEIGPGLGFLTEILVKRAKKVIAVELDDDMIENLKKIDADNLEIIHADILKTDISELGKNIKVVANIPYYITSPIIAHLAGEIYQTEHKNRNALKDIILMTQYEVALRIVANEKSKNKEYGPLSILSQFYANPEIGRIVKSKSFYPSPKVNSAVVKFNLQNKPKLELSDYKFFAKVVKSCFAVRRKNIKNSLLNGGFSANAVKEALKIQGIDQNLRGETLSIEKIGQLSETLKGLL